jgi:hypothetical protein
MEKKISLKRTTTIALALLGILTCSILASVLMDTFMANAAKSTYNSAYMTKSGVLSTDSYVLFPFQKKNLTIGFSKYGEMIDYDTKVGMDYNGVTDPWAPNPIYVNEYEWVEGWVINITYWHQDTFYNTWAFALYSDYSGAEGIGGEWNEGVQGGALNASVHGGRKTNGGAVTDPIKILYDGPRRFVALLKTTIYETSGHTAPIVSITFTIIFNKDKKQAIWFKDIKRVESPKRWGDLQIEFAERGQWDLESDTGEITGNAPKAYACFFENQSTVYDHKYQSWYTDAPSGYDGVYDVAQIIDNQLDYVAWAAYWPKPIKHWVDDIGSLSDQKIYTTSSTVEQNFTGAATAGPFECNLHEGPVGYPRSETLGSWSETPMVFVGTDYQTLDSDYTYNAADNKITFITGHYPAVGANIRAFYKVGDGNADVPGTGVEPCSPFTNAEWAFEMDAARDMFRVVTVFGVTDRNDADDVDGSPNTNVLDSEVKYYLNETFNPYDLYDAVHKQEYRWLYLNSSLTAAVSYVTLTEGLDDDIYQPNGYTERVLTASQTWTGYNYTALDGATFDWVNNFEDVVPSSSHSKNWMAYLNASTTSDEAMLKVTPTGFGVNITGALNFSSIVDFGFWYYSLPGSMQGPHIEFELYNNDGTKYVVLGAYANSHNAPTHPYIGTWTHYTLNNIGAFLGGGHIHNADKAFMTRYVPAAVSDDLGNPILDYAGVQHSWEWFQERLGSFKVGSVGVSMRYDAGPASKCYVDDLSVAYLAKPSGIRYERVYNMEEDKLIPSDWDAYCSFAERVLINGTLIERYGHANRTAHESDYMIDFETGNITFYHWSLALGYHAWDLGIGTHVKVLYSTIEENEKGRYEWLVVGRDASTIDSLGAAYVSEAFDSIKDIDVLTMGMDVNETRWGPLAPFVMGGATSGTRADYRDSLGRPHLRDDWCTNIAVASSDMIFVGGPIAQLGTEYFNEFTDAFFASSAYVINDTGQSNKILALSCWAKNATGSGYATIGIYKDLNGTIGLVIWGFDGQDTYYASKWFWDGMGGTPGIVQLQSMNHGVTSIVLEITYPTSDPTHPTVGIVERLGTISEKDQHDP